MRVLVVEDEPKMAGLVKRGLEEEGIAVDLADRGEDAVWMAGSTEYAERQAPEIRQAKQRKQA